MSHDLNVANYTMTEMIDLLGLPPKPTEQDFKSARHRVLMTHPDKSGYPPEYFIFYKKAFEMVCTYLNYRPSNEKAKMASHSVSSSGKLSYGDEDEQERARRQHISKQVSSNFNAKTFNKDFESIYKSKPAVDNSWFKQAEPTYGEVTSGKDINGGIERVKQQMRQQANNQLTVYRGYEGLPLGGGGTNLYEDVDDEYYEKNYISSNLFDKLKYEDIRRVHKDQTVLRVSERDFNENGRAKTVDQYKQMREKQQFSVMNKQQAENMLQQREMERVAELRKKQEVQMRRIDEYERHNQNYISQFMRLT